MRQEYKLESEEALEKEIVTQGYTVDEVKQNIRVHYLSDQVLQREVYPRVVITNDEVRKYYDAHTKDFDQPAGNPRARNRRCLRKTGAPRRLQASGRRSRKPLPQLRRATILPQLPQSTPNRRRHLKAAISVSGQRANCHRRWKQVVDKLDKGQVTRHHSGAGRLHDFQAR